MGNHEELVTTLVKKVLDDLAKKCDAPVDGETAFLIR